MNRLLSPFAYLLCTFHKWTKKIVYKFVSLEHFDIAHFYQFEEKMRFLCSPASLATLLSCVLWKSVHRLFYLICLIAFVSFLCSVWDFSVSVSVFIGKKVNFARSGIQFVFKSFWIEYWEGEKEEPLLQFVCLSFYLSTSCLIYFIELIGLKLIWRNQEIVCVFFLPLQFCYISLTLDLWALVIAVHYFCFS